MSKLSTLPHSALALGFFFGVIVGVVAVRTTSTNLQALRSAAHVPELLATVRKVQDTASSCGVYGLPGSPATVALTSGYEGRPVRVVVESDIFGGEEIEGCILTGLAGLPMQGDSLRVVLPTYQPTESGEALAAW